MIMLAVMMPAICVLAPVCPFNREPEGLSWRPSRWRNQLTGDGAEHGHPACVGEETRDEICSSESNQVTIGADGVAILGAVLPSSDDRVDHTDDGADKCCRELRYELLQHEDSPMDRQCS